METESSGQLHEVDVKCEIIELSDEEVTLVEEAKDYTKPPDKDSAQTSTNQKPKRKRIKKKKDPSQYVQCDRCSKKFATNSQLKKHFLIHTGEKPYVCTECGKSYRQSHHLKTHELSHNVSQIPGIKAKNFSCTECGSMFTRKSSLRTHEKIHTGEKPFSCTICSKAFVQKINLVYHLKMHQDDRQFECDVCNKKFMTRSKLKQHSGRHLRKEMKLSKQDSLSMVALSYTESTRCSDNSDDENEITVSHSPLWGGTGSESEDAILS